MTLADPSVATGPFAQLSAASLPAASSVAAQHMKASRPSRTNAAKPVRLDQPAALVTQVSTPWLGGLG